MEISHDKQFDRLPVGGASGVEKHPAACDSRVEVPLSRMTLMASFYASDDLTTGLRALELLARCAPIDTAGFARLANLDPVLAETFVDIFEQGGYVTRIRQGALLVLTPLAIGLVQSREPPCTRSVVSQSFH